MVSLPVVLVTLAWKSLKGNSIRSAKWRERLFRTGLVSILFNFALFWFTFLVVPGAVSSAVPTMVSTGPLDRWLSIYKIFGWSGVVVSAFSLFLAFTGLGKVRLYAVLAAVGVTLLWVSIGFY